MHEDSLYQLDLDSILMVPTGSLANHLNEVIAAQKLTQGVPVWEAPRIMMWGELLKLIWKANRELMSGVHSILSASQSKLLWTQIIERSKYQNAELTLLNVAQTVKACMRSDRLLSDWRCSEKAIRLDHVSDVEQFMVWRDEYHALLSSRHLLDEPGLQNAVLELAKNGDLVLPAKRLIWYAYDLITAAQRDFNLAVKDQGVGCEFGGPRIRQPQLNYVRFQDQATELNTVFEQARALLEQQPQQRISIVVPDLHHRYAQVQDIARRTFYPNASLTEVQQNNSVVRFSLGKSLFDWPAIEAANCALNLLKPRISIEDIGFLLRSVYLAVSQQNQEECRLFEQWLHRARIRSVTLEQLPTLLAECYENSEKGASAELKNILAAPKLADFFQQLVEYRHQLNERLLQQKQDSGYMAQSFVDWAGVFSQWLALWQWQTHAISLSASTFTQQLAKRWDATLDEFSKLAAVQKRVGIQNALNHWQQLTKDSVFLPKSVSSPILVCGVLEALGRETDHCFLLGMTQDYPPPSKSDPFIPNHHLSITGYPDSSAQASAAQANAVMQNLLASTENAHVSYALSDGSETQSQPSPLFYQSLLDAELTAPTLPDVTENNQGVVLDEYTDTQGPAWDVMNKVRGGAAIFKNQSHCPFKAFVTHQLGFDVKDEPEFGLDHLDRGNMVHKILELIWAELPNQTALLELSAGEQTQMVEQSFEQLLQAFTETLSDEKQALLRLEKNRITALVNEWLEQERKRPSGFSVVERESRYRGQWAGIEFDYILDRVDITESGQCVVVDYKTGQVQRSDWVGERPYEPQLPLYALVRDQAKKTPVSGIAFAQVRRGESKFVELSETDVFHKSSKSKESIEEQWHQNREQWPDIFTELATQFLAGEASVNPVDKRVCEYCELSALCRIDELRKNSHDSSQSLNKEEQA